MGVAAVHLHVYIYLCNINCRTRLHMWLDRWENKPLHFVFQGLRLRFTTAASMVLKTRFMITRAFTISTTASSKDPLTSFSAMAGHSMR